MKGACHKNQHHTVLNATSYLGLVSLTSPSFGTKACPWTLKVPQGQRVNLTFLDLGMKRYMKKGYLSPDCSTSLVIRETKAKGRDVEVCRGRSRLQHLFTSTTNEVTIYIERLPTAIDGVSRSDFLLQYNGGWYRLFSHVHNYLYHARYFVRHYSVDGININKLILSLCLRIMATARTLLAFNTYF
jgi:hypothetical protein